MTAGWSRSLRPATALTRSACAVRSSRPTRRLVRSVVRIRLTGSRTPPSSRPAATAGPRCALLLGHLPGRQLPAPGRRPQRRQGPARAGSPASTVVRHLHGAVLRPGAFQEGAGAAGVPCHPYRQGATCPHGRRVGCWQRHDPDDPRLGEPLCPRCYQAGAQVLWNALAGRLWSRTTIYLYRTLAQLVGIPETQLRGLVRISFAKVAEYQKRGAVHFHAIIRLDAATDCGCQACVAPAPAGFSADLLERA